MTSKYYNKYKYNLAENAMYKKFRILNSGKFSRVKNNDNNINNQVKSNKYQYFPIESDKSKMDGHTIYLVTQEEEDNHKENEKYENFYTEPNENFYITKTKKVLIDNNNLIAQRVNDFSIFRKFNYPLNWRSFRINKKQIYISENQIYDFNKPFKKIEKNKLFDDGINTDNNNLNFFNIIKTKQSNNYENESDEINNSNKISTYKKKLTNNQYNQKIDNNQEIYYIANSNKTSKLINNLNELQRNRNEGKLINLNTENNFENKTIFEETRKNAISKNSSLNEYLNVGTIQNMSLLNRSLDDEPHHNNNLLFQSFNSNFLENINDSKIMGKKFLDGIKNQQRKISLLQAMARYNRFKFRGKFNINKNNNKTINEDNKDKNKDKKNEKDSEIISIKADIKTNYDYDNINTYDNNNDNINKNNNIIRNNNNNYNNKEEEIYDNNNDNDQNENEFSFNLINNFLFKYSNFNFFNFNIFIYSINLVNILK